MLSVKLPNFKLKTTFRFPPVDIALAAQILDNGVAGLVHSYFVCAGSVISTGENLEVVWAEFSTLS